MSVTKILFRQGTTAPSGPGFSGSEGEPLWDKTARKFYITNGTETPTLIGPQVQADWTQSNQNSPSYIFNKPNFADIDKNDNLKTLGEYTVFKDGAEHYAYGIGGEDEMDRDHTQYTVDLEYYYSELNGAPFINLCDIEASVNDGPNASKRKKTTLYISGMQWGELDNWINQANLTRGVPMFWYAVSEEENVAVQGEDFFMRYWINGAKTIDGFDEGTVTFTNWSALAEADGFWKLLGDSRRMKAEIWHTYDSGKPVFDINITWPVVSEVNITNYYTSQGGTLIASINGTPVYGPNVVSGQAAIGGDYGVENLSAFTLRASLADYNARSLNTDPLTPVVLNSTSGGKLYVNEKSPFVNGFNGGQGQIDASASYSSGTLSWQPSSYGRSYRSFVFDSENLTGNGSVAAVTLAASLDSIGTHTDHYLLIANKSSKSVSMTFSYTGGSSFDIKCIPPITVIRPDYAVEISIVTKEDKEIVSNQFVTVRTVAAMTSSEPLQIL